MVGSRCVLFARHSISDRFPPEGPDAELLGRYLAGESSESEAALVRRFLMTRPDAARTLDAFLARLDGGASAAAIPGDDASWATLSARLRASDDSSPRSSGPRADPGGGPASHRRFLVLPPRAPRRWWQRSGSIAAAAAAAAVVFAALRVPNGTARSPAPASRIYTTRSAQRAELELTDGTRITLAPESRLRVAADFGTERRDLYLEGEAYFDVAHDSTRPLTVYAGNASAHDIGTAFAMRSYAKDRSVRIAVREGVVAMSGVGPLSAGDVGLLASDGTTSVRRGVDVQTMLGWLDGRLSYTDTPLAGVVDDLRRWQGVVVSLRDSSLGTLPFTGDMNGLSAKSEVELVARTLGLRVTRDGERFQLATDPARRHRMLNRTTRSSR